MSDAEKAATDDRKNRETVMMLVAAHASHENIARVLGITVPELRHVYADEIRTGAQRVMGEVVEAMYHKAAEGDLEAQELIREMNKIDPANWPILQRIQKQ